MAKKNRRNIYAEVTNKIIEALEAGVAPWVRPWTGGDVPRNGNSQRPYNGINAMLLEFAGMEYGSHEWFTFKGAKKLGGQVRKGERSTMIVFWKIFHKDVEDEITGEIERKKIFFLKHYNVFNREQIDGLPAERTPDAVPPIEDIDAIVEETGARITYGGNRAAYAPMLDQIMMPERDYFKDAAAFYATQFHELAHWTAPRLDRKISGTFGSPEYAREELVAEIASAYLSDRCGLDGTLQHPEYLAHWIKVLKEDERVIFSVAKEARQAAEFILPSESDDSEGGEDQGAQEMAA